MDQNALAINTFIDINTKILRQIQDKIDQNTAKIDTFIDIVSPMVVSMTQVQERTAILEQHFAERTFDMEQKFLERTEVLEKDLKSARNDFQLLNYVSTVMQDSNNFTFKRRLEDVALAMRKAFEILRDLIPERIYEDEDLAKMMKVNAIWATISVALSKIIKLSILCPTGNKSLDEQAAGVYGVSRDGTVYEEFSESLFADTLNDLERFTTDAFANEFTSDGSDANGSAAVRFVPNIQNAEVQVVRKAKQRKSTRHPSKSSRSSKPSVALRSTDQEPTLPTPRVVCLGDGQTAIFTPVQTLPNQPELPHLPPYAPQTQYVPMPPLPDLPPLPPTPTRSTPPTEPTAPTASTPCTSCSTPKIPGGILKHRHE